MWNPLSRYPCSAAANHLKGMILCFKIPWISIRTQSSNQHTHTRHWNVLILTYAAVPECHQNWIFPTICHVCTAGSQIRSRHLQPKFPLDSQPLDCWMGHRASFLPTLSRLVPIASSHRHTADSPWDRINFLNRSNGVHNPSPVHKRIWSLNRPGEPTRKMKTKKKACLFSIWVL